MEKRLVERLVAGALAVGVDLSAEQAERLGRYLDLLLQWNRKVNLTAITDPEAALEGHLVDSLAAVPALAGARAVVDLGAGGGFPGIAMAVCMPESRFTLVDAVGKKVGFLKAAIAGVGIANARAVQARAEGSPEREGVPVGDAAICRAFLAPAEWLSLAPRYVAAGGRIAAMLGAETRVPEELPAEVRISRVFEYRLPWSGAARRVAVWDRQ